MTTEAHELTIERLNELRDRMKRVEALQGAIIALNGAAKDVCEVLATEIAMLRATQEGTACRPLPKH